MRFQWGWPRLWPDRYGPRSAEDQIIDESRVGPKPFLINHLAPRSLLIGIQPTITTKNGHCHVDFVMKKVINGVHLTRTTRDRK